ncbi:MAG: dicarboxylate/amino acid:cation symporter [Planctomycetes bacterium]|nr:dicarboxylate/amino acid:cation symporter [Planctomycetota bacterium]
MANESQTTDRSPAARLGLHWRILIGLVVGAVAGSAARAIYRPPAPGQGTDWLDWTANHVADTLGQIFLRLIFMVVVPLVFCALALGVAGIGDLRKLGRMGLRTFLLTLALSACSVVIGLGLANSVRPGASLSETQRSELRDRFQANASTTVANARHAKSLKEMLLDIIPNNPLQEMVGSLDGSSPGNGMLAVMFFALTVGIAIAMSPTRTEPLVRVLEGVYDIAMTIIGWAMAFAPIGVAGLMFKLTALLGLDIFRPLLWYIVTVLAGLTLQMGLVYSLFLAFVARMGPWWFFPRAGDAILTAFGTASSSATLPTAIRATEENLGVRPAVARFVLTIGATANQNGTALYEGVTVLFLAQAFGVDLSFSQQITVVLMSVLAGVGTAGVPGGSLPLVVLVLQAVGVPGEGIGVILGVDRFLDMCRTTVNVTGDMAVAACIDRWESRS